jgi:hypothetical protein
VLTMDILWAISHPSLAASAASGPAAGLLKAVSGPFAVATPPYADGSWDMYQDFVGGLQFWGYALVSGSGDSAVRMWDSKFVAHHSLLWLPSYIFPHTLPTYFSENWTGAPHINGSHWSRDVCSIR